MIDLTKFEGHTAGPWFVDKHGGIGSEAGGRVAAVPHPSWGRYQPPAWVAASAELIAAAPDLLAEVIRLRASLYSIDRQFGHDDKDDALRDEITAALEGGAA